MAPRAEVERRLLASLGAGRFERFAVRVAEMFDLARRSRRELLGLCERAASWVRKRPACSSSTSTVVRPAATADCGIVRITPGGTFPLHRHLGEERSLVLSGTLRDHDGALYRAGDELVYAPDSSHLLTVEGDEDVIFVARAFNGIDLGVRPPA